MTFDLATLHREWSALEKFHHSIPLIQHCLGGQGTAIKFGKKSQLVKGSHTLPQTHMQAWGSKHAHQYCNVIATPHSKYIVRLHTDKSAVISMYIHTYLLFTVITFPVKAWWLGMVSTSLWSWSTASVRTGWASRLGHCKQQFFLILPTCCLVSYLMINWRFRKSRNLQ